MGKTGWKFSSTLSRILAVALSLVLVLALTPALALEGSQESEPQQGNEQPGSTQTGNNLSGGVGVNENTTIEQSQPNTGGSTTNTGGSAPGSATEGQQQGSSSPSDTPAQGADASGILTPSVITFVEGGSGMGGASAGGANANGSGVAGANADGITAHGTSTGEGDLATQGEDSITVTYVYPPLSGEIADTHDTVTWTVGYSLPAPTKGAWTEDPEDYGMVAFRGWFALQYPSDLDEPYNLSTELTEAMAEAGDISLYAVFSNTYLMTYKDQDGKVIQTNKLTPDAPIYGPTQDALDLLVPPAGTRLVHWYVEGTSPEQAFTFGASALAQSDLTFRPYFSNNYLVIFNSGGSYVAPQTVVYKGKASLPSEPTRAGYEFVHWYEDGTDENTAFDFAATEITKDTVLVAKWKALEVGYTVAIWMEVPNFRGTPVPGTLGDYNYVTSVALRGTAGAMTDLDISSLPNSIASLFTGSHGLLKYGYPQSVENREILGNGNTVINLYAARTEYSYTLNLGDNNSNTMKVEANGITYTGGTGVAQYAFKAKYEMDITMILPVQGHTTVATFSSGFASWARGSGITWKDSQGIASVRKYLDISLISQDGQQTSYILTAKWDATGSTHQYRYLVKAEEGQDTSGFITIARDGEVFLLMSEYNQGYQGNLSAKTISGFEALYEKDYKTYYFAEGSEPGTGTYYTNNASGRAAHRCFFYERLSQPLTFNLLAPEGANVAGAPSDASLGFGLPLTGFEPSSNPTDSSGNYTFVGWYRDADYSEAFDWSIAMPIGGITAYAKWESTENTVTFLEDRGGTEIDRQGVVSGGNAEDRYWVPGEFVAGKGQFAGWYYDISGIPVAWTFTTEVHSDYTLYATWKTSGFKVTYSHGAGGAASKVPVDTNTYNMYTTARVLDDGSLVPPLGEVFYAWEDADSQRICYPGDLISINTTGDVTLVALYAPLADLIEVVYHANDDANTPDVLRQAKRNSTFSLAGDIFTRDGYTLAGWATSETLADAPGAADLVAAGESGYYQLGEQYTIGLDDVEFWAVWRIDTYTVSFVADSNGALDADDTALYEDIEHGTNWADAIVVPRTIPDAGYYFVGWIDEQGDPVGADWPATIVRSHTYTAVFAQQTPVLITVEDKQKVYGEDDPAFTWRSGEPEVSLWLSTHTEYLRRLSGETVRAEGYAISGIEMAGAALASAFPHFGFTEEPGILNITQRPLAITAGSTSGPFTGGMYTVSTHTQNGLLDGHQIDGLTYINASQSAVGTHTVTLQGPAVIWEGTTEVQDNYTIEFLPGYITITPVTVPFIPGIIIPGPGPTIPGPVPTPAPAPAPTPEAVPDEPTPAAEADPEAIPGEGVPLDTVALSAYWALVNLILAIITVLVGVVLLVTAFKRNKKRDETEEEQQIRMAAERARGEEEHEYVRNNKSGMAWRILGLIAAVAAPILFILTEDMTLPMQLVDVWTIWMVVILLVQVVAVLLMKRARNAEEDDKEEDTAHQSLR